MERLEVSWEEYRFIWLSHPLSPCPLFSFLLGIEARRLVTLRMTETVEVAEQKPKAVSLAWVFEPLYYSSAVYLWTSCTRKIIPFVSLWICWSQEQTLTDGVIMLNLQTHTERDGVPTVADSPRLPLGEVQVETHRWLELSLELKPLGARQPCQGGKAASS